MVENDGHKLECQIVISVFQFNYYRPQRSWGKIIFSEACVRNSIHRGVSAPLHAGIHTPLGPEADTPPPQDQRQTPHPDPRSRLPPSPPQSRPPPGTDPQAQCMLGDTGNKRAVRILLECILVFGINFSPFILFFLQKSEGDHWQI